MATPAPGGGCDIIGLVAEMRDVGSDFVNNKKVKKRFGQEASNIVATVFEKVFGLPKESYKAVKFTKGNIKTFERKLNDIMHASEKGQLTHKFGSLFYTPEAIARKNPHLMKLMDNLHNTNLSFQGRSGKNDRAYNRVLDGVKRHILVEHYQKQGWIQGRSVSWNLNRATKEAARHEATIEKLAVDAYNNVPFAKEKLAEALRVEDSFYRKGEGKVFNDMINVIEKTLPKIHQDAYKAWESKAGGEKGYRAQLLAGKLKGGKKRYDQMKEAALKPILENEIKSAPLRDAVIEYMELMNNSYGVMIKGIKAYGNSLKEGMKGKYSNEKIDDIVKKIIDKVKPDQQKGYYPHYRRVLSMDFMDNLMPRFQRISDMLNESFKNNSKGLEKAIDELNGYVTGKARSRQIIDLAKGVDAKTEYSRNFFVNIKRYTDEISRFNMVAHADLYTKQSLNAAKEMFKKGEPLDGYASSTVEMMMDMNARMKGGYGFKNESAENAMKTLLALEFTSKLGFNLRSPARNATQGLLNMVEFGPIMLAKSNAWYNAHPGIKRTVEDLMDKSGFLFAADAAPELIEGKMRGKSFSQKVKINENEEIEFKKPAYFAGTYDKVGKLAGVSGRFMSTVENFNRRTTFKLAFYEMYNQLRNSSEYMNNLSQKKSAAEVDKEVITRARNYALRKTTLLHFDYSDIAKSSWLTHPTGRLLGQFQHYGIKFFEYNLNLAKEAKDDIQNLQLMGPQAKKAYRMGLIYLLAPMIATAVTGTDFGNMIEHDTKEKIEKFWTLFTGEDEEVKDAFYGKGVLTQLPFIGAPAISDLLALGNIYGFLNMDDETKQKLLVGWEDYALSSGSQKAYETFRVLNTSLTRLYYKTLPRIANRGPFEALGYELGFYKTPKAKKMQEEWFDGTLGEKPKVPQQILDALAALEEHRDRATEEAYFQTPRSGGGARGDLGGPGLSGEGLTGGGLAGKGLKGRGL